MFTGPSLMGPSLMGSESSIVSMECKGRREKQHYLLSCL